MREPKNREIESDHETHRLLREIIKEEVATHRLLHATYHLIESLCSTHPTPGLGGFVAAVHGRRTAMVTVPVPKLLDTEKILLSVMPRKADGHVDIGASITWLSSDEAQGKVEPGTEPFVFTDPQFGEDVTCPGNFNAFATTPNESGSFSVTVSAPGYESATFGPIEYAPGVARSLNASVGSPVSDL